MARFWELRDRRLELGRRTLVMGILNVTPDSFSDGGRFGDLRQALTHASKLVRGGADLIDVGGESTRPGAEPVPPDEEIRRVVPVVKAIAVELDVAISVDTSKAEVASAALDAGAHVVNDVRALSDSSMASLVARHQAGVILMHMRGEPRTMQQAPRYGDVVADVRTFLEERIGVARRAGIEDHRIVVDPGLGFGKTFDHNWEILRRLDEVADLGHPVLVGPSRKAFLGELLGGASVEAREAPTQAAAVAAVLHGAAMVRLHDPAEARPHLAVADRIRYGKP